MSTSGIPIDFWDEASARPLPVGFPNITHVSDFTDSAGFVWSVCNTFSASRGDPPARTAAEQIAIDAFGLDYDDDMPPVIPLDAPAWYEDDFGDASIQLMMRVRSQQFARRGETDPLQNGSRIRESELEPADPDETREEQELFGWEDVLAGDRILVHTDDLIVSGIAWRVSRGRWFTEANRRIQFEGSKVELINRPVHLTNGTLFVVNEGLPDEQVLRFADGEVLDLEGDIVIAVDEERQFATTRILYTPPASE